MSPRDGLLCLLRDIRVNYINLGLVRHGQRGWVGLKQEWVREGRYGEDTKAGKGDSNEPFTWDLVDGLESKQVSNQQGPSVVLCESPV